jgi:heterodisulfide reductase subunit B
MAFIPTKVCSVCKELMYLETEDVVYSKTFRYAHFDCLVNSKFNKKKNKLTLEEIQKQVRELQEQNKQWVIDTITKDKFWGWLQIAYELTVIPSTLFTKMVEITNGTYRGLAKPIPLSDIYDMWQRKKPYLDKVYLKNKQKDNDMNVDARLQYDLAVIINKYDSYLKWKENNKIIEQENILKVEEQKNNIDYSKMNTIPNKNNKSGFDILDILNDI